MSSTTRSSNPLHNFSLPPNHLRWGSQRVLRCTKLPRSDSTSSRESPPLSRKHPLRPQPLPGSGTDDLVEIEDVREKLMRDLRMAAKKMIRSSVAVEEERMGGSPSPDEAATAAAVEAEEEAAAACRPWNLRTRRAACRAPNGDGGGSMEKRVVVGCSPGRGGDAKREREKFSVVLSREEVELDYLVMIGTRPPRRPKKRPRIVQKQLELVFPGSWLTEITLERYRVPDSGDLAKQS